MLMTLRVSGARISVHQGGGRDAGLETPGPDQAPRIIPQGGGPLTKSAETAVVMSA